MCPSDSPFSAPCPLCGKPIRLLAGPWTCPCCGQSTDNWNPMAVCQNCSFAPFYYKCLSCSGEFEMMTLIGKYTDKQGRVLPVQRKPAITIGNEYSVGTLDFLTHESVHEDPTKISLLRSVFKSLKACQFPFPCRLKVMVAHAVRADSSGTIWVHGFLYATDEPEESCRVGQIVFASCVNMTKGTSETRVALVEAFPAGQRYAVVPWRDHDMPLRLKEVEPINISPSDNDEAAAFLSHLTGKETFDFAGCQQPRVMLIHSMNYAWPHQSFAHAFLLSTDYETFMTLLNSDEDESWEPIMKPFLVGTISIELGGRLQSPTILATPLSWAEFQTLDLPDFQRRFRQLG